MSVNPLQVRPAETWNGFAWREMWERNGGLDRFGFPLTEQYNRTVDGVSYTIQVFERVEMRLMCTSPS